jgi:hypothetical protein
MTMYNLIKVPEDPVFWISTKITGETVSPLLLGQTCHFMTSVGNDFCSMESTNFHIPLHIHRRR